MEPRPSPERRFYSPDEAAAVLGISPDHVRASVKRGDLPGRQIGKLYRLPKRQIDPLGGESRPQPARTANPASTWS